MLKKLINFIGNPDVDSLSSVSDAISVLTLSRQFEMELFCCALISLISSAQQI